MNDITVEQYDAFLGYLGYFETVIIPARELEDEPDEEEE